MFAKTCHAHVTKYTTAAILCAALLLSTFSREPAAMEPAAIKQGALVLESPFAFATPPAALSAGGYLNITNTGDKDDVLVGGSATFAETTEIHEMKIVDDMMMMRELENGLLIPAGETIELKPGGLHVMFMQLTESLAEGKPVQGTLIFKETGSVAVEYQVVDRKTHMKGKKMHKH